MERTVQSSLDDVSTHTLVGANLSGANLSDAYLRGANLRGANLRGATLVCANLSAANLSAAHLSAADLRGANLNDVALVGANLRAANLSAAHLRGADLSGATLVCANLSGANLSAANLCVADLRGANLHGANLRGVKGLDPLAAARLTIVPEGELIVYKKLLGGVICQLRIDRETKRSNATERKCRAERAFVLSGEGSSTHDPSFKYVVGKTVECDQWEEDRWVECGGGIHFFLTREEAEDF